jgi:hypothetical protein
MLAYYKYGGARYCQYYCGAEPGGTQSLTLEINLAYANDSQRQCDVLSRHGNEPMSKPIRIVSCQLIGGRYVKAACYYSLKFEPIGYFGGMKSEMRDKLETFGAADRPVVRVRLMPRVPAPDAPPHLAMPPRASFDAMLASGNYMRR